VQLGGVERRQRGEVVHVADVLAQPRVSALGDGKRVLQVGADRKSRRHVDGQGDGQRGVTAGSPDGQLEGVHYPHDGVVARHQDLPVVHQPSVGQARKPRQRVVFGETDRLATEVARRHHQNLRTWLVVR
jgi:hypothetical protein